MKGVVFNLLEEVVTAKYGEDTWEQLLEVAGLDGAYTAVGSYPDEHMEGLLAAASSALDTNSDEILVWFGHEALPRLYQRYPGVFEGHTNTKSFVLTLNEVIHPEVRKLFPGAYVPEFEFNSTGENQLSLSYTSRRRLCSFAEGLLNGAAEHFGETVEVRHVACMKEGDEKCILECTFRSLSA